MSEHHQGERGERSARAVQRNRALAGVLNREKFTEFVRPGDTVLDFGWSSGELLVSLEAAGFIGVESNAATRAEAIHAGLSVLVSYIAAAGTCGH